MDAGTSDEELQRIARIHRPRAERVIITHHKGQDGEENTRLQICTPRLLSIEDDEIRVITGNSAMTPDQWMELLAQRLALPVGTTGRGRSRRS